MNFFLQWLFLHLFVLVASYLLAYFTSGFFKTPTTEYPWVLGLERRLFKYIGFGFESMTWLQYLYALLRLQLMGFLGFYILARLKFLSGLGFSPDAAFQLAASFVTNTNWTSTPGEQSWSLYLWIFGVVVQNFLSAGTGVCVLLVIARCFLPTKEEGLGNFWVDIWRVCMYLLLPLATIFAILLVAQGVPQNLKDDFEVPQIEQTQALKQYLPMGPIASFVSIRNLGTNGGGYTFANGAHPYENPNSVSMFLQMASFLLLPSTCCFLFGFLTNSRRRGFILWLVMLLLSSGFTLAAYKTEGLSMLGKEMRFGAPSSVLWHALTTSTSTGTVNAMVDWFKPLTTGSYLFLMNLGEIAFGGIGMGVVNLLFVFITTAFIMNLLIGSSPDFLSKPLPIRAIKVAMFYLILCPCLTLIVFSAMVYLGYVNHGNPYQTSALWYEISSMVQNNGSAFLGYGPDSVGFNYFSGVFMLTGRYGPIILALAFAGMLDNQNSLESPKQGFILESALFCVVSISVIMILTLLAFLPLWSFGPLAGQLAMA